MAASAGQERVRRAALIVRVSTDMQAANPEGSLTTQLQRLRQHLAYKRDAVGPGAPDRLIELLAIGIERWLAAKRADVDLPADLSVHADVPAEHRPW